MGVGNSRQCFHQWAVTTPACGAAAECGGRESPAGMEHNQFYPDIATMVASKASCREQGPGRYPPRRTGRVLSRILQDSSTEWHGCRLPSTCDEEPAVWDWSLSETAQLSDSHNSLTFVSKEHACFYGAHKVGVEMWDGRDEQVVVNFLRKQLRISCVLIACESNQIKASVKLKAEVLA